MPEVLPNHDTTINGQGFYAQQCKSDQPYQAKNFDEIIIEMGMPRVYESDVLPRHFTFQATLYAENRQDLQEQLQKVIGIQSFTSIYMGSFNAMIKVQHDWPDGYPETLVVSFDVKEVGD